MAPVPFRMVLPYVEITSSRDAAVISPSGRSPEAADLQADVVSNCTVVHSKGLLPTVGSIKHLIIALLLCDPRLQKSPTHETKQKKQNHSDEEKLPVAHLHLVSFPMTFWQRANSYLFMCSSFLYVSSPPSRTLAVSRDFSSGWINPL